MRKPLAIDLYCGLGGWTEGLLAGGYDVIGFDIERHQYGEHRYPGLLVIQDVTTLHGSQFKNVNLIVASPPCQAYSYRAMPWKRAKALPPPDNTLFEACFRIQREACEAAGRHIPLIVENVKGAQKWVGRARWSFGSFYLWGDVPALMPITRRIAKRPGHDWNRFKQTGEVSPHWRMNGQNPDGRLDRAKTSMVDAALPLQELPRADEDACRGLPQISLTGLKTVGHPNIRDGHAHTRHLTNPAEHHWNRDPMAASHGRKRKEASAMIAKIPLPLSRHIAATFR